MALRAAISFLVLAAVWTLGIPDALDVQPAVGPDRYADAMGVPQEYETVRRNRYRIDPVAHRAGIERVEAVLYRRAPTDFGDSPAVESGASRLAEAVMRSDGMRGRQAGLVLLGFASRVGARTASGYSLPSLVDMRSEWEEVRGTVFASATWMRTAGPDLDRIQEPPPPPMDPRTDASLATAEQELGRLLTRGRREAERLGEPTYDPDVPGRSDAGQIRAWYLFGERWRRQLAEAMAPIADLSPRPDHGREPLRAEAVRALEEAHEMLRRVPDGAGMWPTPFRPSWEARFRAASSALARARNSLAHVAATPSAGTDHAGWSR